MRPDSGELTSRQKVAVVMIALGQENTAEIMKYLNDAEIEAIAQAIAEVKTVTAEQEDAVVEEFQHLLMAGKYIATGGVEFARGALEKAIGPRRAQQVLDRVTSTGSGGFSVLRNIAPSQIAPFISKEHPQTIALILSQLDPGLAAGVLNLLPEGLRGDVTYRMATMENVSPQVLREIEEGLSGELRALLTGQITEIGGPKRVAEILNLTGRSTEKGVLEKLDAQDPETAEQVRNLMFTFEDIARLTDLDIQTLLRNVEMKDLAIALKGASPEMQNRFFSNMSEGKRKMFKEEMAFAGPVRLSDVEERQLRIVQAVRQLEEAGQISISRGGAKDVFI